MIGRDDVKQKEDAKQKDDKRVEREAEEHRERMKEHADEVTISSDESFPASDAPSFNPGITGASDGERKKKKRRSK